MQTLYLLDDARSAAVCALHEATAIYTAAPVVNGLLERANWPARGGVLLDPSAGDGAFLVAALARLAPAPADWAAADRVRGYEIHPGAVAAGRERIVDELSRLGWPADAARVAARRILIERDFLLDPVRDRASVVATNPPYLRFARVPEYFKNLYRSLIADYALGDLLHAFLAKTQEVLEPDGCVVAVTADRWLMNQTASELRAQLGQRFSIAHLARLDETSCFYRAKTRVANTLPRCHPVEMVLLGAGVAPRAITSAPVYPDPVDAEATTAITLGQIADVRMTPWLGPEGVFVLPAAAAAALPEGDWVPVVDTDDIDPHTDQLSAPTRYGLRSQRGVEPTGALSEHLLSGRERLSKRARKAAYWMPPESLAADLAEPSLLIPRIARRLRCIDLPAGVQGMSHNVSVASNGTVSLELIRRVLLAPESQAWLERHAPRLEGGFFGIRTGLLRQLPVPASVPLPPSAVVMKSKQSSDNVGA